MSCFASKIRPSIAANSFKNSMGKPSNPTYPNRTMSDNSLDDGNSTSLNGSL
jgi:hypothetical protein